MSSDQYNEEKDKEHLKLDHLSPSFTFPEYVGSVKYSVEWVSRSKMMCDLKLQIHCYDERARFIEKLHGEHKTESLDGSCHLMTYFNPNTGPQERYVAKAKIDLDKVDARTAAIAIYLNGEPRIFQYVDSVRVECSHIPTDGNEVSFMLSSVGDTSILFETLTKPHKDYQGICLCVMFKESWLEHTAAWAVKTCLEPVYVQTTREKDDKCLQITVHAVPALERYRPKIFDNIRDMCAALSSRALPKLKKSFMRSQGGLNLEQFTTVLFNQLYESHPRVIDKTECGYVVALIHEMFHQMDYNNDNCNDWDEFTTFCVQIGVGAGGVKETNPNETYNLDEYVIEYGEDIMLRDNFLSQQRGVNVLRYVPYLKRFILIQEDGDQLLLVDEDFKIKSTVMPSKLISQGAVVKSGRRAETIVANSGAYRKIVVYDCIYLTGRDLFAISSSDHSIIVMRESTALGGGTKSNYLLQSKIYHNMLHLKLCWMASCEVLCSVGSDHTIYGWNLESSHPVFQVSRHEDIITDFIAVDHLEVFVTCSMDKRIVMWSAKSRRVRGILLGHQRGVRCLDYHENYLLSAGFETDAKTWDLASKEQIGVLKGHRTTISAAKMMCQMAVSEKDYRAVTVDESGEFRLWDIYIAERTSEPAQLLTLQIFEMHNGEPPLNRFKFISIPCNPKRSSGNYSDMVACSTKLFHFLPEKNSKEFVAPSCCCFNPFASAIATAVGKNISKYDITTGRFITLFPDIHPFEISTMCLDQDKGRYLFVGCNNGDILLVNFMTGAVVDKVEAHSKEVTCMISFKRVQNKVCAGFADGKLKMLEEINGKLRVHNTLDDPFGVLIGVQEIRVSTQFRAVVASAIGHAWGVWNDTSFRRICLIKEKSVILGIEVIKATLIKGSDEERREGLVPTEIKARQHLLTIAVAMSLCVRVYTIDLLSMKGIISYELLNTEPIYITNLCLLKSPMYGSVNYSISLGDRVVIGQQLVATTDGGHILSWDANKIGNESERKFYDKYARLSKMESSISKSHTPGLVALSQAVVKIKSWSHHAQQVVHSHESELEFARHANGIDSHFFLTDHSVMNDHGVEFRDLRDSAHDPSKRKPQTAHGRRPSVDRRPSIDRRPSTAATSVAHSEATEADGEAASTRKDSTSSRRSRRPMSSKDSKSSTQFNTNPNLGLLTKSFADHFWGGHLDSIVCLVPLHDHSCVLTVSLDGYHRIWNLNENCLGEMPLPNITDKMKNPDIKLNVTERWQFILEKLTVSREHEEFANQLVSNIVSRQGALSRFPSKYATSSRMSMVSSKTTAAASTKAPALKLSILDDADDEMAQIRADALESLSAPLQLPEDAPPNRALTREEKRLEEKNKALFGSIEALQSITKPSTAGALPNINAPLTQESTSSIFLTAPPSSASGPKSLNFDKSASEVSRSGLFPGRMLNSMSTTEVRPKSSGAVGSSSKDLPLWSTTEDFCAHVLGNANACPASFSDNSLFFSRHDGYIDGSEYRLLRKVAAHPEKVSAYDRAESSVFLRNPHLTTSFEIPDPEDVHKSEISFGTQKDLYKHATKYIEDKDRQSKQSLLNSISMARISRDVRQVPSMIHVLPPRTHDDVVIPKEVDDQDENDKLRSEEQKIQLRLMQSAALVPREAARLARPLDKEGISNIMNRFKTIVESSDTTKDKKRVKKKKSIMTAGMKEKLEAKFEQAIKDAYKYRRQLLASSATTKEEITIDSQTGEPVVEKTPIGSPSRIRLTTRQLLPYYSLDDVTNFMDTFAKVDEDFSGDLDINEWVRLFGSINVHMSEHDSRMIFMKMDKNGDGFLAMRELIPIIFSRASKAQQKLIIEYATFEMVKKQDGITTMTLLDMEQLFELLDVNHIGYVSVALLRHRVQQMNISEQSLFMFLDSVCNATDDEMVNLAEFIRLLKLYVEKTC